MSKLTLCKNNFLISVLAGGIGIVFLFTISCSTPLPAQNCFSVKGQPPFMIGEKFDLKAFTLEYGVNESGENWQKDNGLIDYGSADTALSNFNTNGQVTGLLVFTQTSETNILLSLNVGWMFMKGDDQEDRLAGLRLIKSKFLNCLNLEKIDINKGGSYTVKINGITETFTLHPRIREDGTDVNYWVFNYSIK